MEKNISIRSILTSAWIDFKKSKYSILAMIIIFFMALIPAFIGNLYVGNYNFIIVTFVSFVLSLGSITFGLVMQKNLLDIVYDRKLSWSVSLHDLAKILIINISMQCIMNIIGQVLLAVNSILMQKNPDLFLIIAIISTLIVLYCLMIYFSLRVGFIYQFIIEQKMTIAQAFQSSWNITQGRTSLLVSWVLVSSLMILLSFSPLFLLGLLDQEKIMAYDTFSLIVLSADVILFLALLFIAVAMCILVHVHLFKKLQGLKQV